jgi:hypothetical protein
MSIPVIESSTSDTQLNAGFNPLVLTAPTNVATGDLLLIQCWADYSSNTDIFPTVTGFTKFATEAVSNTSIESTFYWRIANGDSLEDSVEILFTQASDGGAFYHRVIGVSGTPIHKIGTYATTSFASAITVPAVTTTVNDCLLIYFVGMDGSDGLPFSVTGGTGWTRIDDLATGGTSAQGVGFGYGTKTLSTAGSSGTVQISNSGVNDGMQGVILAISGVFAGSIIPQIMHHRRQQQ